MAAPRENDPYLDEGMVGYIENTARREHWRLAEIYPGEDGIRDLVQDGYFLYYKCKRRYVDVRDDLTASPDEKRWFQALIRTAFTNHIFTLAAKRKGVSERPVSAFLPEGEEYGDIFDRNLPPQPEMGTLMAMLSKAPEEIKQLIKLLAQGPDVVFQRRKVGRRSVRETTNELYCRLIGADPQARDMVAELRAYFG